jgi:hypothetical protein
MSPEPGGKRSMGRQLEAPHSARIVITGRAKKVDVRMVKNRRTKWPKAVFPNTGRVDRTKPLLYP